MSVLGKLRRKSRRPQEDIEPLWPKERLEIRKMSDVMLEFTRPLLDAIDDEGLFEHVIVFATICWNMSFLPEKEQRQHMRSLARVGRFNAQMRFELEQWAQMLLDRKKALYADERRMVLDFQVMEDQEDWRLFVTSSPTEE